MPTDLPSAYKQIPVLAPGSEQYPAPRRGDPPAVCSQCGSEMMFHVARFTDGGTWTCNCETGWAQQKKQFKWFALMILAYIMIVGLAV